MSTRWPIKYLSEILSLEYGKSLPKSDRDAKGKYPVYGANGIKVRSNRYFFDEPTLIIGRKGSAGEINYSEALLEELSERGYSQPQLEDLTKVVHGEDSDLFDVLAYVAYHKNMIPRLERVEKAKVHLNSYNPAQQEFINFVLEQYANTGISELDDEKLPDLLELKYNTISDAKAELGDIRSIRDTFIGFQGHLYEG